MDSRYEKNVFINCPFDKDYSKIFYAITFTILECGFQPRCALEVDDATDSRLKKIFSLIKKCRLGIHDLSRTQLDKKHQLPRFNMPFELGIFLGAKHFGVKKQKSKNCLVLDSKPYRFQKFISDIAGHDIKAHKNQVSHAINSVREWLQFQTRSTILPSGMHIQDRYYSFQKQLPLLCIDLKLSTYSMLFHEYCYIASEWIKIVSFD